MMLAIANTFVHTIMYMYYGLKVINVQMPSFVAPCITTVQLIQMTYLCIGINIGYWKYEVISAWVYAPYFAMVFLFWGLFAQFFYGRYILRNREKASKDSKKKKQ